MAKINKAAVEIFRIEKNWDVFLELARYMLYAYIAWLFYDGAITLATKSPEQIGALTIFLRELTSIFTKTNMPIWAGWPLAFLLGIAWTIEHAGKKRAIKKCGHFRKLVEDGDPGGRTSSGLSETGDTPEE